MTSIDDVQDLSPRNQYVAAADQTEFDYTFPIFLDADLVVDIDGEVQVLTTDYTVSGKGNDTGGTVTLIRAIGEELVGGEVVTIYRDIAIARDTDIQQNGPWSSVSYNDEMDKVFLIMQELKNKIGRAIRFPITSASTNAQAEMAPISGFLGKFLRITSAGILEAAEALDNTVALSAEIIGQLMNPQTAGEVTAGVTPIAYRYPVEAGFIDLRRYGWVGDDSTDDLVAYQSAFSVAKAYVSASSTQSDDASGYSYGGAVVFQPSGRSYISSTIEIPYNVTLRGLGRRISVIRSDYNGQIVRSEYRSGTDPYSNRSGKISGIRILGSGSGASQVGLDILRWAHECHIEDVEVGNCGSHNVILRECVGIVLDRVKSSGGAGDGIVMQSGVNNWTDLTATNLPCNACSVNDCVSMLNDGAGLRINDSNGIQVNGGFYQENYDSGGDNVGYNIVVEGDSVGITLNETWCEGPVQAHIYVNSDSTNATQPTVTVNNARLIANGATGTIDRALICNKGVAIVNGIHGNASPFKTINSSQAPLQCNKTNNGKIFYYGPVHTGVSVNGSMIEDENNLDYNLNLFAQEHVINASNKRTYGHVSHFTESNQVHKWTKDTGSGYDSEPWFAIDAANGLAFSSGSATADVFIGRAAANVVGCVKAGDGLSVGNDQANTNTPSGATAHAIPIYNEAGTLLGYMPVYAAPW